jgi:SAM-dependent methyltransferase
MLDLAERHNSHVENIEWLHGDGRGLGVLADDSVTGCFSHVVFQHIPDPATTANYVREMGRVLRPGGWALFQVSTDPSVHRPPQLGLRRRLKAALSRQPDHPPAWWGSAVRIDDLRAAGRDRGLEIERVFDEGSQYTTVFGAVR